MTEKTNFIFFVTIAVSLIARLDLILNIIILTIAIRYVTEHTVAINLNSFCIILKSFQTMGVYFADNTFRAITVVGSRFITEHLVKSYLNLYVTFHCFSRCGGHANQQNVLKYVSKVCGE